MFNFRDITLEDKELVNGYLTKSKFMGNDYSFATLFMWRRTYRTKISEYGGYLIVLRELQNVNHFIYPAGSGDLRTVIKAMIADTTSYNRDCRITSITKTDIDVLNNIFPGEFDFIPNREEFDYIYDTQSLINLPGKNYHSKRNHINKFIAMYGKINYEDITDDNIAECETAYEKWLEGKSNDMSGLKGEYDAMTDCFRYYKKLGLCGGLIRVKDKVCSFSFGSRINNDTFGIQVEKSLVDCQSGYAVINREFAERHAAKYKYINREDDLGLSGLRKAKLSYKPVFLLEKYTAVLKDYKKT